VRVALPLRRVWLVYALLGLIGLVFAGQLATLWLLGDDWVLALGAKVNAAIAAGQYWRLVTPIFIHVDLLHLGFNLYALYYLGRDVERVAGAGRLGLVFAFAGLAGNSLSVLMSPSPAVGASGAIFGLIGASAVFFFRNRRLLGARGQAQLRSLVMLTVLNLALGLRPGIDNWAHLGGLLGGLAMGWVTMPLWGLVVSPAVPDEARAVEVSGPAAILPHPAGTPLAGPPTAEAPSLLSGRLALVLGLWVLLAAATALAIIQA
jgi:rhomboid protease GluP